MSIAALTQLSVFSRWSNDLYTGALAEGDMAKWRQDFCDLIGLVKSW